MGLVHVEAVVKKGCVALPVKLLVDSGATYTVLERDVWERLGLEKMGDVELVLAGGTTIKRGVSEVLIELKGYGE